MNILIIGCGQLGLALAQALHQKGHCVTTISRSAKMVPSGITHFSKNIHDLQADDFDVRFDWVYVILTSAQRDVAGYRETYLQSALPIFQALQHHAIQKIVLISSTRVYGENQGQWVDDMTLPAYHDDMGAVLYQAEQLWSTLWQQKLIIIRPSGLIRNLDFWKEQAKQLQSITEYRWLNFIYQPDVVMILASLPNLSQNRLKAQYILNTQSILRHDFLNCLRVQQGLEPITIKADLDVTGKRLVATHLEQILPFLDFKLTMIVHESRINIDF